MALLMPRHERLARSVARAWAGILLVAWGAFFVEHAVEWFAPSGPFPPVGVWLLQLCHLVFLIGLIVGWRWELTGGIVTLVSAVMFFASAGPRAPAFIAVAVVPAVIWIALGLRDLGRSDRRILDVVTPPIRREDLLSASC